MRCAVWFGLAFAFAGGLVACEERAATSVDAAPAATVASAVDAAVVDAAPSRPLAPVPMPERPVPREAPTVTASMSADVQMKAIVYMAAMSAPHPDDPPADPKYAASLAEQLVPIVRSLDKGPASEKAKLDRVDVIAEGRKIDLLMAGGCDQETPVRAVVSRAQIPLSTLLGHGVLVVRCNDAHVQCFQSTRDQNDVLCTTAPRHK